MRSDTANNTANAFKYSENGGTIESLTWAYLTDRTPGDSAQPDETELVWLDRKKRTRPPNTTRKTRPALCT